MHQVVLSSLPSCPILLSASKLSYSSFRFSQRTMEKMKMEKIERAVDQKNPELFSLAVAVAVAE
jgi:hypothetical protein